MGMSSAEIELKQQLAPPPRPTLQAIRDVGEALKDQKKVILAALFLVLLTSAATFGMTVAAIEATKETKVESGVLSDIEGKPLTTGDGVRHSLAINPNMAEFNLQKLETLDFTFSKLGDEAVQSQLSLKVNGYFRVDVGGENATLTVITPEAKVLYYLNDEGETETVFTEASEYVASILEEVKKSAEAENSRRALLGLGPVMEVYSADNPFPADHVLHRRSLWLPAAYYAVRAIQMGVSCAMNAACIAAVGVAAGMVCDAVGISGCSNVVQAFDMALGK